MFYSRLLYIFALKFFLQKRLTNETYSFAVKLSGEALQALMRFQVMFRVRIQKTIEILKKKREESIAKKARRRALAAAEIVSTEQFYVDRLTTTIRVKF